MRRILHITMADAFSGAENVVCQIVVMYRDDPDTEMLFCGVEGENIRAALECRGVPFVPMAVRSPKEVARVIRETQPDIIHAHDMKASLFAALTCGKIPLISHIHNNNYNSRTLSLKAAAYAIAAHKAAHIFWVSKSSYEGYAFHRRFAKKSSILYNVIDIDEVRKRAAADTAEYRYDIVYVGRLTYPKNPERLMDVLAAIAKRCPTMRAAVIGTGELLDAVEKKRQELHLTDCVDLLGYCTNPYKIIQSARLMLMTSRWEGLPMCALEAMALGVPIVCTPTDGLAELIEDGCTGFLREDNDELADAAVRLLTDDALHNRQHDAVIDRAASLLDCGAYKAALDMVYQQCARKAEKPHA